MRRLTKGSQQAWRVLARLDAKATIGQICRLCEGEGVEPHRERKVDCMRTRLAIDVAPSKLVVDVSW